MKRAILILIVIFLLCLNIRHTTDITGIEHFSEASCAVELSKDLFPNENFLSAYAYIDGDYALHCTESLINSRDSAFAFLRYSPKIYEDAKQYCLNNFNLCEEHQYIYAGYTFNEHLSHFIRNDENEMVIGCCYPRWFNAFAYCDETCTLIFIGYYNSNAKDSELELAQSDFGAFVESVYSKYYQFE